MIFTAVGQLVQGNALPCEPFAIRALGRNGCFELFVGNQAAFLKVQQEHFAGLQASLELDVCRVNMNHADFGCHDDFVVMGDVITAGTQTIAIQNGANVVAVRKHDGRRAIPRFYQCRMELIKSLFVSRHINV